MIPLLMASKYFGKKFIKDNILDACDSKEIKPLNAREDYALDSYNNPSSPLYKNKELIKEYYNPNLPIDKKIKDWDATDLVNITNSPLYKYDTRLKDKAREYIKYREDKEKRRLNIF